MKTMLRVTDLSVLFGHGPTALRAVDSVSFSIPQGKTLALVGESGSGKSTIAKAIVGLAPVTGGRVEIAGNPVETGGNRRNTDFRRRVQMVFQDPYASLNPSMSVGSVLSETVALRGNRNNRDVDAEVTRLFDLVRLPASAQHKYPHEFSGGQRQRIAIARALAVQPEVILMDEVTSALDVSVQATILNLLKDLQDELGLTYLFISHDLSVVATMSDEVAVLYLGRVVEKAMPEALMNRAEHPYTQGLIASIPGRAQRERWRVPLAGEMPDPRNPPSGCHFRLRCPVGPLTDPNKAVCSTADPGDISLSRLHAAACHFAPAAADPGGVVDLNFALDVSQATR